MLSKTFNESMKYLISAVLLAMSFAPLAARADILPEGEHPVVTTAWIDNTADFLEYDFYLTGSTHAGGVSAQPVTGMDTSVITLVGEAKFIAVKTSDKAKIVSGAKADCPECGDNWFALPANAKYIVTSNYSLTIYPTLPDENPTTRFSYGIHIDSLNGQTMHASTASTGMYDKNLKTVTPDPSLVTSTSTPTSTTAPSMTFVWIIVACLGVAILALAIKAWKK
jgi:hypothetical protein